MILVVAGIIRDDTSRVCLTKRTKGKYKGCWEFPGGKVENNETTTEALCRELKEELGIDIIPSHCETHWFTSDNNLVILFYTIKEWKGTLFGNEGQELKWFLPEQLFELQMPPLDQEVKNHIFYASQ